MKITFDREQFQQAFQTAAAVAPSRSPKPILQNIKLDATESGAIMMATDMEVGVRIEVSGVEVEAPGSIVLPVQRFGSILREVSDEKLRITREEGGTIVQGERSKFTLSTENPEEFPAVHSFTETKYHELSARTLKELIRRTLFAADSESGRYALGGILLEMEADQVTAVATDGRRLSKMSGPAVAIEGHGSASEVMTIVPARAMQLIEKALTNLEATVQIAARSNDVLVKVGAATIYARLVEGRFPKWRDVLPEKRDAKAIELTVGPAFAALRQAAIVASDESRGIDFTFGGGSAVLSSTTAEVGQSHVEFPIAYDGDPVEITMDHRYVADFYKVLDGERQFTLNLQDADSAALFSTDDNYDYVVMPLARDR
ncbi:DNA polymerase III subunit beta [Blastopirellula marina]|uniref:Beta sliding clamp n=1 Tax=Blastopirellula marina DSM 3645 TaxID=314230 RepID=A3ZRF0_9BACT|nr:DNA polymerase III subunit beta [Blastopirellula marina]EAQ80719.1 DNA polymerase III, beta chain [Blastopirellula marina DSM 3645]